MPDALIRHGRFLLLQLPEDQEAIRVPGSTVTPDSHVVVLSCRPDLSDADMDRILARFRRITRRMRFWIHPVVSLVLIVVASVVLTRLLHWIATGDLTGGTTVANFLVPMFLSAALTVAYRRITQVYRSSLTDRLDGATGVDFSRTAFLRRDEVDLLLDSDVDLLSPVSEETIATQDITEALRSRRNGTTKRRDRPNYGLPAA